MLTNTPALAFAPDHHRALPLGAGKGEIDGRFQVLFRIVLVCHDEVHGVDEGLVRGGGARIKGFDDTKEGLAMRGVKSPHQGLIAIPVMRTHLLALCEQVSGPSGAVEDCADLRACFSHALRVRVGLQDIGKDLDEVLGGRAILRSQSLQLLFGAGFELPHACNEHLHDLVAGGDGGLMKETHQESKALGRREIPEVGGMQGSRFLCQMDDLGRANLFEQGLRVAQGLQPGEAGEPFIQVGERSGFGNLFDPVEGGERGGRILLKKASERVLLLFCQTGEDGLIDASIHQCANAPGHAIQRAKGGQFAVFASAAFQWQR